MDIIISCIARKSGAATQCFGKAVTQKGPRCSLDVDVFARCRRAFSCLSGWLLATCPRDPGLMVPVTIFFIAGSSGSSVCIGDVGVPTWFCCSLFALGRRGEFVAVHTLIYSDARKCFETRHTTKSSLVRMRCGHGGETTLQEFMIFHGSSNLFEAKFMVVQQQFNCVFNGTL